MLDKEFAEIANSWCFNEVGNWQFSWPQQYYKGL